LPITAAYVPARSSVFVDRACAGHDSSCYRERAAFAKTPLEAKVASSLRSRPVARSPPEEETTLRLHCGTEVRPSGTRRRT